MRAEDLEIGSSVASRVKSMTYKINTFHFLAWCLALIGYGKDWLVQCQDNMAEWDIGLRASGLISQWDNTIKSP